MANANRDLEKAQLVTNQQGADLKKMQARVEEKEMEANDCIIKMTHMREELRE